MSIRYHSAVEEMLVPADTIRPHRDNPNNGDVDSIIESILINGCYRPIYCNAKGTILAGHHLYAALLELGATTVPVMFLDTEEDDVPEAVRIMLVDNASAAHARIDRGLEAFNLGRLSDYHGTGYTQREAQEIIAKAEDGGGGGLSYGDDDPVVYGHANKCPECGHSWREIT